MRFSELTDNDCNNLYKDLAQFLNRFTQAKELDYLREIKKNMKEKGPNFTKSLYIKGLIGLPYKDFDQNKDYYSTLATQHEESK